MNWLKSVVMKRRRLVGYLLLGIWVAYFFLIASLGSEFAAPKAIVAALIISVSQFLLNEDKTTAVRHFWEIVFVIAGSLLVYFSLA